MADVPVIFGREMELVTHYWRLSAGASEISVYRIEGDRFDGTLTISGTVVAEVECDTVQEVADALATRAAHIASSLLRLTGKEPVR